MLRVALAVAAHRQQVAVSKAPFGPGGVVGLQTHQEAALGAQAQRSDDGPYAKLTLIVTVPAHRIGAAAVAVRQHTVERRAAGRRKPRQQRGQGRVPRLGHEGLAGIAVARRGVAHPAAQAR